MEPLIYARLREKGEKFINEIKGSRVLAVYFIGSTMTSTIPGVSIAGASPELTLYTPAVDVEYLVLGKPVSTEHIPVTPEGIPTPALITRAVVEKAGIPFLVVDTGSYIVPRIPHVVLPSRRVGERIDSGRALPYDTARSLYEEARVLASRLAHVADVVVLGESIPGGTTTALGILVALGYNAWGMVSSAGPSNPHSLKEEIVRKGLEKNPNLSSTNVFEAVSALGDPVHVSIAGFMEGALDKGLKIILAGGTQMAAVLAIAKANGLELGEKTIIGTTKWIIMDDSSDINGLVEMISPETPVIAYNYDFSNASYEGLRYYEKGYVKEGVGAGGTSIAATAVKNIGYSELVESIYREYERLTGK